MRRRRGDREGEPRVPAFGAIGGLELPVALEVQIALVATPKREDVADLRPDTPWSDTVARSIAKLGQIACEL